MTARVASDRCAHQPVDEEPVFGDESVQVDQVCAICGRRLTTTSYTREEWDRRQRQAARRGRR